MGHGADAACTSRIHSWRFVPADIRLVELHSPERERRSRIEQVAVRALVLSNHRPAELEYQPSIFRLSTSQKRNRTPTGGSILLR